MEFAPDSLDDEPSSPLTGYAPDSFEDEACSTLMGFVPDSIGHEAPSPLLEDVPDSLEDEPPKSKSSPKEVVSKEQIRLPSPLMDFIDLEGQTDTNVNSSRFGAMPTDKTSLNLISDELRGQKREKRKINQLQKGNVRTRNRDRLQILLHKLIRRQDWANVAGALSALLQATSKERSLHNNCFKYSGAIETLAHVESGRAYSKDVDDIYNIWLKKIAPQKNRPLKDKFVLFDAIVTFLVDKNYDGARSAAICLKQDVEADNDSMSHLILGLCHYELWYRTLPKHRQLVDMHQQEKSVINDLFASDDLERGKNYDDTSGSEWSFNKNTNARQYFSVFSSHGVPSSTLFPVQWNPLSEKIEDVLKELKSNCDYKDAIDYLRKAVNSTPGVVEALLPLVQILLLNDHVEEAINEIQKFSYASESLFASRLKTHYFECLGCNNLEELCSSYEDILKKDPTCRHAVTRLCQIGDYIPERLLEMIALHLDADLGDHDIWKEFASCLFKVCQSEEDRISTYQNKEKEIPTVFKEGVQGQTWELRCRWWKNRHFNKKLLESDMEGGNLSLMAYKAACATQIYGPRLYYVVKVGAYLKEEDMALFTVLNEYANSTSSRLFPGKKQAERPRKEDKLV